jgi:hypothetical protein
MTSKETVTPNPVEDVRNAMRRELENPYKGKSISDWIHDEIADMADYRFLRKSGRTVRENPDEIENRKLVRDQKACIIADGKFFEAKDIWEDHEDITKREQLFILDYLIDGEVFFWAGLPIAPVIFCDTRSIPKQHLEELTKRFVFIDDKDYKVY